MLTTTMPSGRPSCHSPGPVAFVAAMADATSDNRGPVIETNSTDIDGWFQLTKTASTSATASCAQRSRDAGLAPHSASAAKTMAAAV